MIRKPHSLRLALSTALLLLLSGSALAQSQSQSNRVDPIKRPNNRATVTPEIGRAKGWDGKVQGKALITTIGLTFSNPKDYDSFVAGNLPINVVLVNTVSRQTTTLESKLLTEIARLRPTAGVISERAIHVVVDNMSAPLSEAACGEIKLGAEKAIGGAVNIILSYSECGSATVFGGANAGIVIAATSDNNRVGASDKVSAENGRWVIISGEKNSGDVNITLGDSRVVTADVVGTSTPGAGVIIVSSSSGRGAGSPKNRQF
jgi:hypothetical protein